MSITAPPALLNGGGQGAIYLPMIPAGQGESVYVSRPEPNWCLISTVGHWQAKQILTGKSIDLIIFARI